MPKCPNCQREIDWLKVYATEVHEYRFYLISSSSKDRFWEHVDLIDVNGEIYCCPECEYQFPFESSEEAKAFLSQ